MTQPSRSGGSNVGDRMRARFSAARTAGEPVGILCLRVDRFDRTRPDRVRELLGAVDRLLEQRLGPAGSVSGARPDGRLLLVPGLDRAALETLGRDLVRAARDAGPTASIGVAHDPERAQPELGTLLGVADAGLDVAARGGGNRMVHTEQYIGVALHLARGEQTLEELVATAPVEVERVEVEPEPLPQVVLPSTPPPARPPARASEQTLIETLRQALSGDSHSPRVARFQHALEELLHEHPGQNSTLEQVEILERRVNKLVAALELAEGEIARLQHTPAQAGLPAGISSIYREVQGLSPGEPLEALKRELMAGIFEANAALQGAREESVGD